MTKWTPLMQQRLKALADMGMKYSEIAEAMTDEYRTPFTKNSVIGMAQRIGVPARNVPKYRPARYTPRVFTSRRKPAKGFALEDLGHNHCRWPIDGMDPPFGYCGQSIVPNGRPYCHTHAGVAYPYLAKRTGL